MSSVNSLHPRLSTLERQALMLHHLILVPEGVTLRDARIAASL
ncbi:MAG TPA: hypothetical protein VGR29_06045 [Thermomicrobiales bacterium]|nr:hypothetical protein [Thermomicrobiales bacterium]